MFVVVAFAVAGVSALSFSSAASAYTTIYAPNQHANATLLACQDVNVANKPIVRLKYVGDDSPFIRMRTSFGPVYATTVNQSLTKYTANWTWKGSYPVPAGASTIRITFVFDDNSTDRGDTKLANIIKCAGAGSTTTPPTVLLTAPSTNVGALDTAAPYTLSAFATNTASISATAQAVMVRVANAAPAPPPSPTPAPTPMPTPNPPPPTSTNPLIPKR